MNVSKSLFSLVKYNGGQFKSQKQAAFINNQAIEGVIRHTQQFAFGEYQGCKRSITWMFFVNMKGIQKVVKMNSKGEQSLYWENTEECKDATAVKANKATHNRLVADKINRLSARFNNKLNRLEHIEMVIKAELMKDIMAGNVPREEMQIAADKVKRVEQMKVTARELYNKLYDNLEKEMIK